MFDKVKFHLKYNETYCDYISGKYYQQYIAFHQEVVFLGHKTDTINSILQKLVSQYFDTKEQVYFRSKNVRPSNSLSENEL